MNWKEKQHDTSRHSNHNQAVYTWCTRKWLCYSRWRAYRSNACLCSATSLSKYARSQEYTHRSTSVNVCLLQQINTIVLIQRDYIYEQLSNPARFISIPATPPYDTAKNILQLPELAFLIDTNEGRAILYEFYLAQENYIEALNQWNLRSALHLEYVQPALAASKVPNGGIITKEVLEQEVLGVHIFGSIVNSTENCIVSLQRAFQKLSAVKIKAREYLVTRFKSNDFTDFDFPETYGLVPPEAL